MKNKLIRGLTALTIAGSFAGCDGIKVYTAGYEGYSVIYTDSRVNSSVKISDLNNNCLVGTDDNHDGRYDGINLSSLPKGSPLEKYANIESMKKVEDYVLAEVEKAKETPKLEASQW